MTSLTLEYNVTYWALRGAQELSRWQDACSWKKWHLVLECTNLTGQSSCRISSHSSLTDKDLCLHSESATLLSHHPNEMLTTSEGAAPSAGFPSTCTTVFCTGHYKLGTSPKGVRSQVSSGCLKSLTLLNYVYPKVFCMIIIHKHTHLLKCIHVLSLFSSLRMLCILTCYLPFCQIHPLFHTKPILPHPFKI